MKRDLQHYTNIAVAGFGNTGVSAVRFLLSKGITPTVVDSRQEPPALTQHAELVAQSECHFGELSVELLLSMDLIIVSPGLDTRKGALRMARDAGVVLISDIELFAWYVQTPVIGITGSNGKSTVTELCYHLLNASGRKAVMGGNIGTPALDLLSTEHDCVVLELSSFQLDLTYQLELKAACILNISPDHLDRYDDTRDYSRSKHRIYAHAEHMVWNLDDIGTRPQGTAPGVRKLQKSTTFGKNMSAEGFCLQRNKGKHWICWRGTRLIETQDLPVVGVHNWLNVMAALGLCLQLGLQPAKALKHIGSFKPLPHRCELIANRFNVRWVDDSKATNPGATEAAILGLRPDVPEKLILIAGGDAKGSDLQELEAPLSSVDVLITLGRDGHRVAALKNGAIQVASMTEAVQVALEHATPGSLVLLSPACASLDMFENYQARGMAFRKAVEVVHAVS
ncbi:UDP-N-acetylmuramoyl-L-alanine--D-glutamate ligase [Aliidiomarina taiwanensis]|uniref:UDP-N-acetylmuramoylalanine--D-glutamate ligase n=2 Tax=Aliidiomarina taiwanensis TaxID=946228 RepID=A0A432X8F8_9GAMM|nr:UDP-N-acetylmuramoyl-L-alanine--D-glutamate ligase [Aliidiomarina taiwanensis]